ncbi:hypothetical protein QWZ10_22505 [Paracoccus cavernae]|uniref:Uncharacterized protein n=1 Tax=Paracoccus cavernae TaxID=1571207 RepID=A0ABT8DFH0_9RHOB|nr:hypothetical protein [Paracoccus cavernae]MDN3713844.1 hypothetical protein [Paracoccus cavernae]
MLEALQFSAAVYHIGEDLHEAWQKNRKGPLPTGLRAVLPAFLFLPLRAMLSVADNRMRSPHLLGRAK